MEILFLCSLISGLMGAEKIAGQVKKDMKSTWRKASGKNRRARKRREAKKRAESPGFFALMGKRMAGVDDDQSLRGQIAQLKRQLAQCRRENEVMHHRINDLRKETAAISTSPIHTDCTHQHCLDYKELVEGLNKRASGAASHRWMTKR
ncbi:MAG: hypothetical protein ACR2QF_03190 [Geminicoccaceae bacterium]